jgi:hypothetical protein
MGKRISAAIAMGLVIATTASAEGPKDYSGSYMCRPIGTAGIGYDRSSKEWAPATFDTSTWQHYVKLTALADQTAGKSNNPQFRAYTVLINRADLPGVDPSQCRGETMSNLPIEAVAIFSKYVFCKTMEMDLTINFDSMRYQAFSDGSFIFGTDKITDEGLTMPYVQVGKCVRLD